MNVKRWAGGLAGLAGSVILLLSMAPVAAQDAAAGEQAYRANCASCHQADGSGITGAFPPLADNPRALDSAYVSDTIRNGKSGPLEVNGVQYNDAMPAFSNLSDRDIADIVAFLATNFPAQGGDPTPTTVAPAGPGDADRGEELFLGSDRLENGGAACLACHTAGGRGNLGGQGMGPDLTGAVDKYGGEEGLNGVLEQPPFLVMRELYAGSPLTGPERADLVAYLSRESTAENKDSGDALFVIGLVGAGILFGAMVVVRPFAGAGYSRRLRRNA